MARSDAAEDREGSDGGVSESKGEDGGARGAVVVADSSDSDDGGRGGAKRQQRGGRKKQRGRRASASDAATIRFTPHQKNSSVHASGSQTQRDIM